MAVEGKSRRNVKIAFLNFPEKKVEKVISFLEKSSDFGVEKIQEEELKSGKEADVILLWTENLKKNTEKIKKIAEEGRDYFKNLPVIVLYETKGESKNSGEIQRLFLELERYKIKDFVQMREPSRLPFVIMREMRNTRFQKFSKFYSEWLYSHDIVSDFLRRHVFVEKAQRVISENGTKISGAVFIINIRYFDTMVIYFGREFGDSIVNLLAEKIRKVSSSEDILGRLSERKFIVLKTIECRSKEECFTKSREFATKLIKEISGQAVVDGKHVRISIDIGISIFPFDDTSIDKLIKKAEVALERISEEEGDKYAFFSEIQRDEVTERSKIIEEIFSAIRNGTFFLIFQPIFSVQDTRIKMFEALLRWKGKIVSPEEIVKAAESIGAIYELNKMIIKQVIETASNLPKYSISFNLSPNHIYTNGFYDEFMRLLESYRVEPNRICIEISEKSSFKEIKRAQKIINKLSENGVKIAVDDFGAGQSSFVHLREIPVDMIKVDRDVITKAISGPPVEMDILETIVYLGKKTNKLLVAEGVETEQEFRVVKEIGFDLAQGFFLSHPLTIEEIFHELTHT